jgi:Uma2 family endonuclease
MSTTRTWTVEVLEREGSPEGRWELIEGQLLEMAPSGGATSALTAHVTALVGNHVDAHRLGEVYGADLGVVPFPGQQTVRVLDGAFVATERLPEDCEGFLRQAPDLVLEVVSPFEDRADVRAKVAMWLEAGARLVWVLDAGKRSVTVHQVGRPPLVLGEGDDLTGADLLPGFRVSVSDIFKVRWR